MHRQDASKTYPVTYPKNVSPRCTITLPSKCHAVTISWAGAWARPGTYVYIHRLLHRLGYRIGNHSQLPFVPIQWVTDMLCMILGESLTGVSYAQQAWAAHAVSGGLYESYRGFVS